MGKISRRLASFAGVLSYRHNFAELLTVGQTLGGVSALRLRGPIDGGCHKLKVVVWSTASYLSSAARACGRTQKSRPRYGAALTLLIFNFVGLTALPRHPVYAAESLSREYQIKGAYLYKLADYVEWPAGTFPSSASPLTICVIGQDPFGPALEAVTAGEQVAGHSIAIKRLPTPDSSACQVAYFSVPRGELSNRELAAYDGKPVLTITDGISSGGRRGIINFVLSDDRVRFEIDERAASEVGLSISSKLLSLAVIVRRSQ